MTETTNAPVEVEWLETLATTCEVAIWEKHDRGYPERLGVAVNRALGIASYITDDGNPVISVDAANTLADDCMYRSGHDGEGPDPYRFFCEAITPAPACERVRAVADTEPLARTAAFLRAKAVIARTQEPAR